MGIRLWISNKHSCKCWCGGSWDHTGLERGGRGRGVRLRFLALRGPAGIISVRRKIKNKIHIYKTGGEGESRREKRLTDAMEDSTKGKRKKRSRTRPAPVPSQSPNSKRRPRARCGGRGRAWAPPLVPTGARCGPRAQRSRQFDTWATRRQGPGSPRAREPRAAGGAGLGAQVGESPAAVRLG